MAELQFVRQPGGGVWIAEAPNWAGISGRTELNIGIAPGAVAARQERGQRWQIGQMYWVVGTGLISANHVFRGLRREMYVGDDKDADEKKLAVSWASPHDARAVGDSFGAIQPEYHPAPAGCAFVVYISINKMLGKFPDVYGWAEHWTWVDGDPGSPGAPVEWQERYEERVWSNQ